MSRQRIDTQNVSSAREVGKRVRCPECKQSDGLWEGIMVSGWRSLDEYGKPTGEKETDWALVEEDGNRGCSSCGWGSYRGFEEFVIGIDGEPLPEVHPDQMALTAHVERSSLDCATSPKENWSGGGGHG